MVGEFTLLAAIRPLLDGDGAGVPLGVDDDAAVADIGGVGVAMALDTVVEDVHFDLAISDLSDVGWKAVAVNVSDLAAIGALPSAVLVSLQRPRGFDVDEATALYQGLREAADRWDCRLLGGDTVSSPTLAVSVTVLGRPVDDAHLLRRDGARPGDLVVVVGPLGLAAAGLALRRAGADDLLEQHPSLLAAHRRPQAMLEAAPALVAARVHSAIDISDGLGRDLGHVAEASGVGIRIDAGRLAPDPGVAAAGERLDTDPLELVVGGGEDFALACTLPADDLPRLQDELEGQQHTARVVGEVVAGDGVALYGIGEDRDVAASGWEHA